MKKIIVKIFIIVVVAGGLWGIYFFQAHNYQPRVFGAGVSDLNGKLVLNVLDVGQGDAILIRLPQGEDVLIDGGPDNSVIKKLGQYLPYGDREIEWVILTHPHSDHVTGLNEVLKRYQVDKIVMTGALHTSAEYLNFLAQIKKQNIPIQIIDKPQDLFLESDLNFKIIFPDKSFLNQRVENLNNSSIVGQLIYASTTAILTGDFEQEETLLDKNLNLKSDIYKVGHHGSNNANDLKFIEMVAPTYAVISVGANNQFGHPNYRTLKNLESVGAQIFRTDQNGDVRFISDGQNWQKLLLD